MASSRREPFVSERWDVLSDPATFARVVAAVRRNLDQAGALFPAWSSNRQLFSENVYPLIEQRWSFVVGRPQHEFPWVEDFVLNFWAGTNAPWRESIMDRPALMRAVILTYEDASRAGEKPGSDNCSTNRRYYANRVRPAVLHRWSEDRGKPKEEFPWTDDFVAFSWVTWRKVKDAYKDPIRRNIGLPAPGALGVPTS